MRTYVREQAFALVVESGAPERCVGGRLRATTRENAPLQREQSAPPEPYAEALCVTVYREGRASGGFHLLSSSTPNRSCPRALCRSSLNWRGATAGSARTGRSSPSPPQGSSLPKAFWVCRAKLGNNGAHVFSHPSGYTPRAATLPTLQKQSSSGFAVSLVLPLRPSPH